MMNEEKQRIKILEFLGWRELYRKGFVLRGTSPQGKEKQIAPNPLTNLNVMHEVEQKLSVHHRRMYAHNLAGTCLFDQNGEVKKFDEEHHDLDEDFFVSSATTSQRAEAFLKTLNLWEL